MEQNGDNNPANRDRPADEAVGAAPGPATTRLGTRYTVREAAEILGTTIDGIRGRIRRGTLDSMKVDGVVYVLLDEVSRDLHADQATNRQGVSDRQSATGAGDPEIVEELRDQVGFLRHELERRDEEIRRREEEHREEGRRKDHIIAALTQRILELEAPASPEPHESPGDDSEDAGGGVTTVSEASVESQEPTEKSRSWLARLFFWQS